MEGKFQRKLAAIMFTDIVGYTHMMHINEDRALQLRARHRQVLQDVHKRYGGEILQYFGDGTLSIFQSSVNAVECAVQMQLDLKRQPEVPVRIGIHVGDISYNGTDAFGDGLNVAARIEPICEPGGVFISERVYEDIRNHAWLQAMHVGNFQLKNIEGLSSIFAISSKGMALPQEGGGTVANYNEGQQDYYAKAYRLEGRKKSVAALLALLMGFLGVHQFYLGKRLLGLLTAGLFAFLMIVSINEGQPLVLFMLLLSLVEAVLLFVMPQKDFDQKYNQGQSSVKGKKGSKKEKMIKRVSDTMGNSKARAGGMMSQGFSNFRAGQYALAKRNFEDVLQFDYQDEQAHFMLACCYSLERKADQAYLHLASAVDFGFQEFEEIYANPTLQWLRNQPDFEAFVENGYRKPNYISPPIEDDLLSSSPLHTRDILEQISDLGELMERGEITRDEFEKQKRNLLNG